MKITKEGEEQVKATIETALDLIFWNNIKKRQREDEETIKSLKRENRILREDLSYLELKAKR